jgi:hypothetical protein
MSTNPNDSSLANLLGVTSSAATSTTYTYPAWTSNGGWTTTGTTAVWPPTSMTWEPTPLMGHIDGARVEDGMLKLFAGERLVLTASMDLLRTTVTRAIMEAMG